MSLKSKLKDALGIGGIAVTAVAGTLGLGKLPEGISEVIGSESLSDSHRVMKHRINNGGDSYSLEAAHEKEQKDMDLKCAACHPGTDNSANFLTSMGLIAVAGGAAYGSAKLLGNRKKRPIVRKNQNTK